MIHVLKKHGPRHRGFTLIELMATMSAAVVVLTLTAALVHRMMHAGSRASAVLDSERTALRFSRQVRDDLLRATDAELSTSTDQQPQHTLRLTLGHQEPAEVEYRFSAGLAERFARQPDNPQAHEAYQFPADTRWTVERLDGPPRVSVTATNASADERTRHGPFRVPFEMHVEPALRTEPGSEAPEPEANE